MSIQREKTRRELEERRDRPSLAVRYVEENGEVKYCIRRTWLYMRRQCSNDDNDVKVDMIPLHAPIYMYTLPHVILYITSFPLSLSDIVDDDDSIVAILYLYMARSDACMAMIFLSRVCVVPFYFYFIFCATIYFLFRLREGPYTRRWTSSSSDRALTLSEEFVTSVRAHVVHVHV